MRNSRHSEDSRLYFDWLEIAAQDLLAAQLLTEAGQCLEVAAFHCHQGLSDLYRLRTARRTQPDLAMPAGAALSSGL